MDNEIEVMRVIRVPPMGKLVVEVNGKRYEQLGDVSNAALNGDFWLLLGS